MDSQLNKNQIGCPVPKMGQPSLIDSVLNVPVSYFSSYYDTEPKTINLLDFLHSEANKAEVEAIRKVEDNNQRKELKAKLPAITPSGIFNGRRDEDLVVHSGLVQIDIDQKGNEHLRNYDRIKEELVKIQNIAYCGQSVSGKGLWCIIPIAYPEKHKQHIKALERIFKQMGLVIDASCSNVARLRGISYDPDRYFNHLATPFRLYDEPQAIVREMKPVVSLNQDVNNEVEQFIKEIERRWIDLTPTYQSWFEIGCSMANHFGENGREYYHRISQYYLGYSPSETDKQFDQCLKHPNYSFTIRTFFHYCKHAGITIQQVSAA